MDTKDLYKVLGVERNAKPEEVREAYRARARKVHPDLTQDRAEKERRTPLFQELNEANDILSDPDRRAMYDRYGVAAFQNTQPEGAGTTPQGQSQTTGGYWGFANSYINNETPLQKAQREASEKAKKDEDERKLNEEAIRRQAEFQRAESERIKRREDEIRQKDEFNTRVDQAWQERLNDLTFRERVARAANPNWDFREHNALRQRMEREAAVNKLNESRKEAGLGVTPEIPDTKPMTDWKKPNEPEITGYRNVDLGRQPKEPEITGRRKVDFGNEPGTDKPTSGWSGEHHTVGRKVPRNSNPGGENKG